MTTDTRTAILDAAERLYAERGLDGVSLRQITEEAGQRNNAAVHYHFGGRDGLVRELFETRWGELEARRAQMLADLPADDVPSLVRVMIAPFVEAEDGYWVRFVARLHEDPRFNPFSGSVPYASGPEVMATSAEVSRRLRALLPLGRTEADTRFFLVTSMAVHAVADRHAMVDTALPAPAELLDDLVEAAVAVLTR